MKNKIKKFAAFALSSLALFLLAYSVTYAQTLANFFDHITDVLAISVVRLIFALAFVYFFWGVVQYVLYPDEEAKKDKGRSMMVTGIIALTVMFSVYGLIAILAGEFGLDPEGPALSTPDLPE